VSFIANYVLAELQYVNRIFSHFRCSLGEAPWFTRSLDGLGPGEKTAVNGVNNWLSTNLPTTKEASIQSLNRVLASLDSIEFEVDIALRIRIERNVDNVTVL
jgi:hypothetical protein